MGCTVQDLAFSANLAMEGYGPCVPSRQLVRIGRVNQRALRGAAMATTGNVQAPGIGRWSARSLRMTAFPVEPAVGADQNWWSEAAGGESDDLTQTKKRQGRLDQGTWQGATLSLSTDLTRIVWSLEPKPDLEKTPTDMPHLGDFAAPRRDAFVAAMTAWLEKSCPPIKRLAFGCNLHHRVSDEAAGFRLLEEYLPAVRFGPDSSDFLYRINRRMQSAAVRGLSINRLAKWELQTIAFALLEITPQAMHTPPVVPTQLTYACGLEVDINTIHDYPDELPKTSLTGLFGELVQSAIDIAEKGDRPQWLRK